MSSSARILAVVATLAILVVAFVVLSPGDGDDGKTPSRTQATAPPATTATTATAPAPRPRAEPQPRPRYEAIRVRAGKPVGGVKRIRLAKGDRARIEVSSPDTSDEIHVHGYDLTRDLKAGGRVRFAFDADAEGIFEIELHHSGAQVAELVVEPR